MSRYAFGELVENAEKLCSLHDEDINSENPEVADLALSMTRLETCRAGYQISTWEAYAILGWDDGLETYFLSLEDGNSSVWWFGTTPQEIKSPYTLCAIIERLFDRAPPAFAFRFSTNTIESLKQDRNQHIDTEHDDFWRIKEYRSKAITDAYLKSCLDSDEWMEHDVRTYLCVPEEESSDALDAGAVYDAKIERYYVPFELNILPFASWFTPDIWREAPYCPECDKPMELGRQLFEALQKWAKEFQLAPETLLFWTQDQGEARFYEGQTTSLWQISWERGPAHWAMLLLHGRSFGEASNTLFERTGYYFEPADRHILSCSKL